MSYTPEQLLAIANNYESNASASLNKTAKKKDEKKSKKPPFWMKNQDLHDAKDKKSTKDKPSADKSKGKKKEKDYKKKSTADRFDALMRKFADPNANWARNALNAPAAPAVQTAPETTITADEARTTTLPEQTIVGKRPAPTQALPKIPEATQTALNTLGFKGKDGKALNPDGKLGPNTQFALDAYKTKNKERLVMPDGKPMSDSLIFTVIQRDATGENKTTTFDHKATNDGLNAVSSYLTQLQAWQGRKEITAQNLPQIKTQLAQWVGTLPAFVKSIDDTIADQRSSEQEKTLAKQLKAKADKLNVDIESWNKFFETIAPSQPAAPQAAPAAPATTGVAPTATASRFDRLVKKYS